MPVCPPAPRRVTIAGRSHDESTPPAAAVGPSGTLGGTFAPVGGAGDRRTLVVMTDEQRGAGRGLQRSRTDRVLGGVCAGIADRLDLDPAVVRLVAVACALVSGGAAVVAYVIAWIVVPDGTARPADRRPAPIATRAADERLRDTWSAAGSEVRSLGAELRRPRPAPEPEPDAAREASRTAAIDAALTSLGDRLRDPEVRDRARRSSAGISTAVAASVDAVATRVRRDTPPPPADGRRSSSTVGAADDVPRG